MSISNQHFGRRIRVTSAVLLLFGAITITPPGQAEVGLRVESHPIAAPIDAYVRVTAHGNPVTGLTADEFTVTLDGRAVEEFALTMPPSQDSAQKVSVVIVVDENPYRPIWKGDFSSLVEQLNVGDLVSVVKFWGDVQLSRFGGLQVLPFTEIDDRAGSEEVINFLRDEPPDLYTGRTPYAFFDGLMEGLSQFDAAAAILPEGPKAIVTVACCGGRIGLSEMIAAANSRGIAIFDFSLPGWSRYPSLAAHLKALAANTGGIHVRLANDAPLQDAVSQMSSWLREGYRVSIPQDAIDDCDRHKLAVTVRGESTSVTFSRCDTTPEPFRFRYRNGVPAGKRVRSSTVTITGIDIAVPIRVFGGEYSIGCATGFTSEPGRIGPGESVCVRQLTTSENGQTTDTLLIVGGVSSWFTTTTVY